MEDSKVHDSEVSYLFEEARKKIDEVDKEATEKKKKIIEKLAKDLEGKIQTDSICMKITVQLDGKVSESVIRKCLPEKYKQKHRVENAKKQKREKEEVDNLAVLLPLNQGEEEKKEEERRQAIMIDVDGRTIVQDDDDEVEEENKPVIILDTGNRPIIQEDGDGDESHTVTESTDKTLSIYQQESELKEQTNGSLEEDSRYEELNERNEESIEDLASSPLAANVDKIMTQTEPCDLPPSNKTNIDNEILSFEFYKTFGEVSKYAKQFFLQGSDTKIWFNGKIHLGTGKVVSSGFGRLNK